MIIGLTGLAGSGKSEVARVLTTKYQHKRHKFADPLKSMVRTLLYGAGFNLVEVERMIEGDLKETEIEGLGVTPRHLMITLGTEWGRNCVREDLWVTLWGMGIDSGKIVADDVRFPNEVDAIRARGGEIWKIVRPGVQAGTHISEQLDVKPDRTIINNGSLDGLAHRVRFAMEWACV